MLSLSHEIRPNLFLFPFLFLLRRFAFLFLGPNCIRLRLRLSPRPHQAPTTRRLCPSPQAAWCVRVSTGAC